MRCNELYVLGETRRNQDELHIVVTTIEDQFDWTWAVQIEEKVSNACFAEVGRQPCSPVNLKCPDTFLYLLYERALKQFQSTI